MSLPVFLVLLALSCTIAFFLMRAEQRQDARTGDRAVLDQLRLAGSDLSQPHDVEFFFFAPSEAAASALRESLASDGFAALGDPTQSGALWSVVATKSLVPDESTLVRLRQELAQRAKDCGGSYDGWGSPVVPHTAV